VGNQRTGDGDAPGRPWRPVTRIERPGGDPWRNSSGYRCGTVASGPAVLDLKVAKDKERLVALASKADVLIESFSPARPTNGYRLRHAECGQSRLDVLLHHRVRLRWIRRRPARG